MFDGSPPDGPGGEAGPQRGSVRAARAWYAVLAVVLVAVVGFAALW